ncbi:MAG: AMP-binding protein, partial [bacterium]|nr:AMP-binding protein [bacterium]
FKERVSGKVYKSRIDFDGYEALKTIISEFKPDLIGIRTLSFYKDFFHRTVATIKQWNPETPIISGGPYATSDYRLILSDPNVDLAVLGEGELIIEELVEKMMANGNKLPPQEQLQEIHGIAYVKNEEKSKIRREMREIIHLDEVSSELESRTTNTPGNITTPQDPLYVLYTSGSTGTPKGVVLQHGNLLNLIDYQYKYTGIDTSKMLQFTTATFDVSAQEIFST